MSLKKWFAKSNPPVSKPEQGERSPAEKALMDWGISYKKQPDGTLFVPGNLDISSKGLTALPDLSKVRVGGGFFCFNNQLTSLAGAPHIVGGDFSCNDNQLTSLEHAPHSLGGSFYCCNNQLTSLEHAPQIVGGDFWCGSNQLASLEHAPQSVGGDFLCFGNQLSSLEHAPQSVGGAFYCNHNQLTSLEHTPRKFTILISDFGTFRSWNDVPEELHRSLETRERLELERQAARDKAIRAATVLQQEIKVSGPLQFKNQGPRGSQK